MLVGFGALWELQYTMEYSTECRELILCVDRYRVARLLHTVAMRLRKHTRKLGSFQAWNKCLNHLLELARAHVEAVMFTKFLDGANKCEDLDARKSLKVSTAAC